MSRSWAPFSLSVALHASSLAVSCGSGSNRQLQSISISAVSSNGSSSFVATGTYNAAPITVTPLPTSWFLQDPPGGYQLTTQPFVIACPSVAPGAVFANAPVDPHAPRSGSFTSTPMIRDSTPLLCP